MLHVLYDFYIYIYFISNSVIVFQNLTSSQLLKFLCLLFSLPNQSKLMKAFNFTETCFNCGVLGHLQRNCSLPIVNCFHCGQEGHFAYQCSEKKRGDAKCFNCGVAGHIAANCTSRRGGPECYK